MVLHDLYIIALEVTMKAGPVAVMSLNMNSRRPGLLGLVVAHLANIIIFIFVPKFLLSRPGGACVVGLLVSLECPPVGGDEVAALDVAGEALVLLDVTRVALWMLVLNPRPLGMMTLDMFPQTINTDALDITEGTIVPHLFMNVDHVSSEKSLKICFVIATLVLTDKCFTIFCVLEFSFP